MQRLAALLLALLAGASTPAGGKPVPRLGAVASRLAHHHVAVRCWTARGWAQLTARALPATSDAAAFTSTDGNRIELGPSVCPAFATLLRHGRVDEWPLAEAVGVLAHEIRHAAGIPSESRAECGGIATIPRVAHLLGLPHAKGVVLQRVFRGTFHPGLPASYRRGSCRAGLPAIVLSDGRGPPSVLRALRAQLRPVDTALGGWRRVPLPPQPASPCSTVRRGWEEARVGEAFVRGRREVYVVAVVLHSGAQAARARAGVARSFACFARRERVALQRVDPSSHATARPLPPLALEASGVRISLAYRRGAVARRAVHDVVVAAVGPRALVAFTFVGDGSPVPLPEERRAVRAALTR